MSSEEIQNVLSMIGKSIYILVNAYDSHPYIKAVKVSSVEFYNPDGEGATLKTSNDGCFRYKWSNYYETYEAAEKRLKEIYSAERTGFEPLKPCPICKSPAQIAQYGSRFRIECVACGLASRHEFKLKDAIKRWNDRAD